MASWPIGPSIGLGGCLSIGQERNTSMAYCAFVYTVMTSFCHAYDTGAHQLRESNAYHAFNEAWRDASKNAIADLVPNPPPDKSSLNSSSLNTGRRDGPAPSLFFCVPAQKMAGTQKRGAYI